MRFGLIHRLMTDALATLGVLALVASGALGRWTGLLLLVGLAAALAVPEAWQNRIWFRRFAAIAPLALLTTQLGRVFFGVSTLDLAVEFAAGLQIVRLATRRGAAHDQQVIVLALLHLIAATMVGGGLAYGFCFLGFLIIAPGALVLSHLRREVEGNYRQGARDRTGLPVDVPRILRSRRVVDRTFLVATCLLSIPIFCFTAVLFVAFPRVGLSLLLLAKPRTGHMVGFSDHVDLGVVGKLRTDPTIAMRIEISDLPAPPPARLAMHLRGAAFDTYDGKTWSRTPRQQDTVLYGAGILWIRRAPNIRRDRVLHIDLEPFDTPVLFAPLGAVAIDVHPRGDPVLGSKLEVRSGPEGQYFYRGADEQGLRYDVYLGAQTETFRDVPSANDRQRYLSLPASLPARVRALAHDVTKGATTPSEKAVALETHLRGEYAYDLSAPPRSGDPIDDFLFVSRRGHCEFYSTAMVLLLRELGIPARNVTGFIGGTYNRFGRFYVVRQGDAHSWVEAFLPNRGWQTFDPTPPADAAPKGQFSGALAIMRDILEATGQRWDRYVVGYDLRQQMHLVRSISHYGQAKWMPGSLRRSLLVAFFGAAFAGSAAYFYWSYRRRHAPAGATKAPTRQQRQRMKATALFEMLDGAMSVQGIARNTGTPPLLHAEMLAHAGHPLAEEILDLTNLYLAARFGAEPISEESSSDFETRVRRIRTARHLAPRAA
jgi:protein-glutamine gamma-glutamyltransferase